VSGIKSFVVEIIHWPLIILFQIDNMSDSKGGTFALSEAKTDSYTVNWSLPAADDPVISQTIEQDDPG
jgi:hypothetical protein